MVGDGVGCKCLHKRSINPWRVLHLGPGQSPNTRDTGHGDGENMDELITVFYQTYILTSLLRRRQGLLGDHLFCLSSRVAPAVIIKLSTTEG